MVSLATFTATFLGTTSPAYTARYIWDGTNKIITITFPETRFTNTGASTAAFTSSKFPLPAEIRPSLVMNIPSRIVSGGTILLGVIAIYPNGSMAIGTGDNSNSFITCQSVGLYSGNTITYTI